MRSQIMLNRLPSEIAHSTPDNAPPTAETVSAGVTPCMPSNDPGGRRARGKLEDDIMRAERDYAYALSAGESEHAHREASYDAAFGGID
jgi:hypothetical protein